MLSSIKQALRQHFENDTFDVIAKPQLGGDIHQSFVLTLHFKQSLKNISQRQNFFLKTNSGIGIDVLESEFESLNKLNTLCPNLYPQTIFYDRVDGHGLLFMSFHDLSPITGTNANEAGRLLAQQHKISSDNFGWSSDNFIGLTPQLNRSNKDWPSFFRQQRLEPMMLTAIDKNLPAALIEKIKQILVRLEELLCHEVKPSLVHGDLWSGNLGFDQIKQGVLFYDPAPYYGDREVDLAMTKLFGRQPESFYQAYQQEWPLPYGYQKRVAIYNLYHALNHVILFGASYFSLVENCLQQITHAND